MKTAKDRQERFHYCMPMEVSEWEYYGLKKRPSGMAEAYSDYRYFKKRSRSLLKKIEKRINDIITNDELLKLMLINDLDSLDKEFKKVAPDNNNEIDIIGHFFRFIAHLLGWAHFEGRYYRTPIYYQEKEQQEEDLRKSSNLEIQTGLYECYRKRQIIKTLISDGNSLPTVASIMGMSLANAKTLERNEEIDRLYRRVCEEKQKKQL